MKYLPQAFPSLSTGIFGYPIEDATNIALDATRLFLDTPEGDQVPPALFGTYIVDGIYIIC